MVLGAAVTRWGTCHSHHMALTSLFSPEWKTASHQEGSCWQQFTSVHSRKICRKKPRRLLTCCLMSGCLSALFYRSKACPLFSVLVCEFSFFSPSLPRLLLGGHTIPWQQLKCNDLRSVAWALLGWLEFSSLKIKRLRIISYNVPGCVNYRMSAWILREGEWFLNSLPNFEGEIHPFEDKTLGGYINTTQTSLENLISIFIPEIKVISGLKVAFLLCIRQTLSKACAKWLAIISESFGGSRGSKASTILALSHLPLSLTSFIRKCQGKVQKVTPHSQHGVCKQLV